MKIYAGIGSREVPLDIELLMYEIGQRLGSQGWLLRSGHADGSDLAFERGCIEVGGKKEIFYPGHVPEDIIEFSIKYHPFPHKLKSFGRQAMGRNAQIILGEDLKTPSQRVVGYCRIDSKGNWIGGTSHGFRIAKAYDIPTFNLFDEVVKQKFIKKLNDRK